MKCVKCSSMLTHDKLHGIDVDTCPDGHGTWHDAHELDQLEDTAYDEDDLKGSMIFRQVEAEEVCPHCQGNLQRFQYRLSELYLDYCPDGHGYWLDAGEEKRIVELMNIREADIKRKASAEADWANMLQKLRRPSFLDKLMGKGGRR